MKDFRHLKVWEKAHGLTLRLYRITRGFPAEERFGLMVQLRRAAASIGANLAEGCGRGSDRELAQFAQIAMGSASELEYHLLLAPDLELLPSPGHRALAADVVEVKKMLAALLRTLRNSRSPLAAGR